MELTSSVVPVVVGALLARIDTPIRALRRHIPADHQTIYGGWWAGGLEGTERPYVIVRCAPDRSRMFPETPLDTAREFASEALGGCVPPTPSVDPDGLELVSLGAGRGPIERCRVWRYGLIELCRPIGLPVEASRPFTISAGEVAEAVLLLTEAIRSGWYRRLYAGSGRARLDWTLAVTTHISDLEVGSQWWEEITFPGRRPSDRGHRAKPPAPARAVTDVRKSQRQGTDPHELARVMVGEFAHGAAYRGYDDAVRDAVEVGAARIATAARLRSLTAPSASLAGSDT